jgi:MFS family permease
VVVGLAVFATADPHTPYFPSLALTFLLTGVGAGLASAPLLTIAMANVPSADAGIASGMVKFSSQISGAIAVAVLGALASAGGTQSAAGYRTAIVAGAVCAAIALGFAATLLRRRPSELAQKHSPAGRAVGAPDRPACRGCPPRAPSGVIEPKRSSDENTRCVAVVRK